MIQAQGEGRGSNQSSSTRLIKVPQKWIVAVLVVGYCYEQHFFPICVIVVFIEIVVVIIISRVMISNQAGVVLLSFTILRI